MTETQTASKDGATLIAEERQRQIAQEGWTAEHDDQWADGQLADAAGCYALEDNPNADIDAIWPWDAQWWKPKDRKRNLIRAGALIAAEIDRLQRAEVS